MNILYLFKALLFESMAVKGEEDRKPENTHNFLSLVCFHSLEIQVIISSRSFIQNYQSKQDLFCMAHNICANIKNYWSFACSPVTIHNVVRVICYLCIHPKYTLL